MTYFQDHNFTFWFMAVIVGMVVLPAVWFVGTAVNNNGHVPKEGQFALVSDLFVTYGSLLRAVEVPAMLTAAEDLQQSAQRCALHSNIPECPTIAQKSGMLIVWLTAQNSKLAPGSEELATYIIHRRALGDLVSKATGEALH